MPDPAPEWLVIASRAVNRIGGFGIAIPLLIGLWRWKYLTPPAKALVWYFAFWTVEAPINLWSRKVLHTNIYLHHLDVLVETWLLGWMYYRAFGLGRLQRWLPVMGVAFTLLALADATVLAGLNQPNAYARLGQTLLMLSVIILYFDHYMQRISVNYHSWDDTVFRVSIGLAIYYAGSITGYIFFKLTDDLMIVRTAGLLIDSLFLVALVLMTWAISRDRRDAIDSMPRALAKAAT
ncbi:hypothetical protein [Hymenobacter koreensis]|uniref:Uncharacterized protein n=1 Tax=Hymenobacter koreensis TaxID=1084523 RepID=A0ABP8IUA1_9BACT